MKTLSACLLVALCVPLAFAGPGDCLIDPDPPAYYKIDLVTTKKVPGTGLATGAGHVRFVSSPFGIALSPEGHYVYTLSVQLQKIRAPKQGVYVAWVSTPNLDVIQRLGPLDEAFAVEGQIDFNKFIVIITLEPDAAALGATWTGPVVLRGMSKSGFMHTMAGHGPFEQEPCAQFGYN